MAIAFNTALLSICLLSGPLALTHSPAVHPHPHAPVAAEPKDRGITGDPKKVRHTLDIRMTDDTCFVPQAIQIKRGETVRLVAVNAGKVLYENVTSTAQELKAHAEMMKKPQHGARCTRQGACQPQPKRGHRLDLQPRRLV